MHSAKIPIIAPALELHLAFLNFVELISSVMENKRHAMVSYENMSEELAAAFAEKYPRGQIDYLPDVRKIDKPDGTSIYTVSVEIPDAIYLVKVKMKIDDAEELNKWLDEESGDDVASSDSEEETLPDDNIAQYGGGDDDDVAE